jgi:SepF-like predicted cell division protein (DUF552 family)
MTQKDNILQELSELKSTLANITPQNIYTVPAGYFDGLAAQVLARIKAIEAANVVEEMGYLSPMLSKASKEMFYNVPAGYFEGLTAQVLNRIKATESANAAEEPGYLSPVLSKVSKQMPYGVPAGYFEGLAENIMQSVRESSDFQTAKEELETLSPLLVGLKKQMPYSVPQGYFENLTEKIVAEENKPTVKVISITSRKWFRYAAAAVITGLIVMAGFIYFNGSKEPGEMALNKFTRDVKKLDETQKDNLIEFIDGGMNSKKDLVAVNTEKINIQKQSEVKELLQGVSDEELKDFQEQTEDIEDVLMTN